MEPKVETPVKAGVTSLSMPMAQRKCCRPRFGSSCNEAIACALRLRAVGVTDRRRADERSRATCPAHAVVSGSARRGQTRARCGIARLDARLVRRDALRARPQLTHPRPWHE